jgi:hypothetical protein
VPLFLTSLHTLYREKKKKWTGGKETNIEKYCPTTIGQLVKIYLQKLTRIGSLNMIS